MHAMAKAPIDDQQRRYAEDLAIRKWGHLRVIEVPKKLPATANTDPWYIVQSEPRRETVAAKSLRADGFECFYPTRNVTKLPHRKKFSLKMRSKLHLHAISSDEPVFASYLFVRPGPTAPGLRRVFGLQGVRGVVHFGERLAVVKNDVVEIFRSGEYRRLLEQHFSVTAFPFKIGEKALLKDGPLAEHSAIIDRVDESNQTVHVLVNLLGRSCRVITKFDELEKA